MDFQDFVYSLFSFGIVMVSIMCKTLGPAGYCQFELLSAVLASKNTAMRFVSEDVWRQKVRKRLSFA